jgi:hypothetical protein
MGRRYCFHLFYPIDRLATGLDAVNGILPTLRRKRTGKPIKSAMRRLSLENMGSPSPDSPVFLETSLLFPADDRVRAYYPLGGVESEWTNEGIECLPVGLIDLAIRVGGKYALLSISARTSGMSDLFADSVSVWGQLTHLLNSAGGLVGLFDDEKQLGVVPYPLLPDGREAVELEFFDFVLEERDNYWHLDADRFATAPLQKPRIVVPQGRLLRNQ